MCRFSVTQPSQQVEQDLADGFNWFDAIDEICTEEEDDQLLVKQEQLAPQPGGNLLDVWCQQIGGELALGGAVGWLGEPASAAVQQAPEAAPVLHQPAAYGFMEQVTVPAAHVGVPSMSSGSVDDGFSCDGEQPMASGGSETQQKHNNNAAGKHTVTAKHTKVSKAALAAMDETAKLERVKQKRRESASRSRARKNAYMKELEAENAALKGQVESLQKAVGQLQAYITTMGTPMPGATASMACC